MKHPELIRKASVAARIPVLMLLYDAFCFEERAVSKKLLWNVYHEFIHTDSGPQFLEDYALYVLAGRAERIPETRSIITANIVHRGK